MKKIDLFIGCFGNGVVFANKAVIENGDYKRICHISNMGVISWSIPVNSIPGDVLLKIEHEADTMRANYIAFLQRMDAKKRYSYILERLNISDLLAVCRMKEVSLEKKLQLAEYLHMLKRSTFDRLAFCIINDIFDTPETAIDEIREAYKRKEITTEERKTLLSIA